MKESTKTVTKEMLTEDLYYYFSGNIENSLAVCNLAGCGYTNNEPYKMTFDAAHCVELPNDIIKVKKKLFNRLYKNYKITYIFPKFNR